MRPMELEGDWGRLTPEPCFEGSGADLSRAETRDGVDGTKGTVTETPTLKGATIPTGTQPGDVLPTYGKGLNKFRSVDSG